MAFSEKGKKSRMVLTVLVFLIFLLPMISDYLSLRTKHAMIDLQADFLNVTTIKIDSIWGEWHISNQDGNFEEIVNLINPFSHSTGGLLTRTDMNHFKNVKDREIATIYFLDDQSMLFYVDVYAINMSSYLENSFYMGDYLAVGFVNGTNYMAKFSFSDWDELTLK